MRQGHLLTTDSEGRHLGFNGQQFISEIPSACANFVPSSPDTTAENVCVLPVTDTYTILLDGQTLTLAEVAGVTQFGPGHAVWVDGIALDPASRDQLVLAQDGTRLAYGPNCAEEVTLGLAVDGEGESCRLQTSDGDVGAGQVVTLTTDVGNGQLVFNNAQAGGGRCDLDVR